MGCGCIKKDCLRDTTVLDPMVSNKLRVARYTPALLQSYDLHKIQLTQKGALLEQMYFAGSMPLFIPNHSFMICGGPEAITSATIFEKCGGKTSSGRQEG